MGVFVSIHQSRFLFIFSCHVSCYLCKCEVRAVWWKVAVCCFFFFKLGFFFSLVLSGTNCFRRCNCCSGANTQCVAGMQPTKVCPYLYFSIRYSSMDEGEGGRENVIIRNLFSSLLGAVLVGPVSFAVLVFLHSCC